MRDFERKLQASLTTFASDIELLLRHAAASALEAVVGAHAAAPIRRTLAADGVAPRQRSAASRMPRAVASRRRRRSPENLARLTRALDAYIRKNKGLGIEAIGKAMGASTRELALPMKKLLAERRVATRGARRATRYYPR
jgi:hypothetical protein